MKVNEIYIQLALTYRLSLKTMMRLTSKSQEEIYDEFVATCNYSYYRPLKFLFEQDAVNESDKTIKTKEFLAKRFLLSYKKGNTETKKRLLHSLTELDKQFKELIVKAKKKDNLTEEECEIIMKFRIKYAYSQNEVMDFLNRDTRALVSYEEKVEDPTIQKQLEDLNFYNSEKSKKQIEKFKSSYKK